MSKINDGKAPATREETRDAILEAAFRVLGRYGYPKASMVDVAREAGIGRATLYLYFSSKEEIALAAMARLDDQLCTVLTDLAHQVGSHADRLRGMLRTRVLFRFDFAAQMVQSMDDVYRAVRTGYLAHRDRYDAIETGILADLLEKGRAAGEFAFDDAHETAATLLTCTNALLPFGLSAREMRERNVVTEQVERMTNLLLRALRLTEEKEERK